MTSAARAAASGSLCTAAGSSSATVSTVSKAESADREHHGEEHGKGK